MSAGIPVAPAVGAGLVGGLVGGPDGEIVLVDDGSAAEDEGAFGRPLTLGAAPTGLGLGDGLGGRASGPFGGFGVGVGGLVGGPGGLVAVADDVDGVAELVDATTGLTAGAAPSGTGLGGRLFSAGLGPDRILVGDGLELDGATSAALGATGALIQPQGPVVNGAGEWCGYDGVLGQSAACLPGLSCINGLCVDFDAAEYENRSTSTGSVFSQGADPYVELGERLTVEEMEAMMAK